MPPWAFAEYTGHDGKTINVCKRHLHALLDSADRNPVCEPIRVELADGRIWE